MDQPTPSPDGPGASPRDHEGLLQSRYPEVSISSVIFGVVVGAIMNAAITYAGLKIGFTIVGSSIAAVLGFGVLRGVLRRGTILEVNIGQTIASAVNTPNSGIIFTVPVLMLLGYQFSIEDRDFWLITLAGVAGAILGCAFIVPLRKQMLDIERLRFPSATAVGAILKSPGAGAKKSVVLLIGVILAALFAAPAYLPQITRPAAIEDLDRLVEEGRINRSDLLLTRAIDSWMEAGAAPAAVVEHGAIAAHLTEARLANSPEARAKLSVAEQRALSRRVKETEQRLAAAANEGAAAVAAEFEHESDRARFRGYPLELARRVLAASRGEAPWESLRDTNVGWAADPLWGYADLQVRAAPDPLPDAPPIDFAYNGLGSPDPVHSTIADQNRDGQPDLLITDTTVNVGRWLGLPAEAELLFAIAPFALGAGYLTGRAGLFVLAGGVLAYLVINPVMYGMGWMSATTQPHQAPQWGYLNVNRPLGIGLLLGGALMGIIASLPAIKEAFRSIAATGSRGSKQTRDELGLKVLAVAACGALVVLFLAADLTGREPINTVCPMTEQRIDSAEHTIELNGYVIAFADADALTEFQASGAERQDEALKAMNANRPGLLAGLHPHVRAAIIALVGAMWIWFAGIIIAQCTGMTDWSPISGMALLTVVLVMLLSGPGEVIGAVLIGVALCVAITCASDMMADLKTGYIVGAQPKRQQVVEIVTSGLGPILSMLVLLVIAAANVKKYGVPIGPGTDTAAPQAQALQAVITGVQGGAMPYALYGFGALLGALLGLGAFSGLGVLIGLSMYLPMHYIATYGIGCVLNMIVTRVKGPKWAEEWGVPLAAGLIVGDALLSLGVNSAVLLMT